MSSPVRAAGRLERTERAEYRLEARFHFQGETTCSRCLRTIPIVHDGDFALLLLPHGEEPQEDEHALSPGELDLVYYQGDEVEVDPLVAEQVVLAVPMKPLCREDCRGICSVCGANRNETDCACSDSAGDPRWGGLAELRKNLDR